MSDRGFMAGPAQRIGSVARQLMRASGPLVLAAALVTLHGCQSAPGTVDRALAQGLQVAEAAVAVDQLELAGQLYQSLVERYPDAPAPRLRLARIAFEQGDFRLAYEQFVHAAGLPLPERGQAEAWFGAGRSALALEEAGSAADHFQQARALIDTAGAKAWVANGLAVAATLDADLQRADSYYREAIELDPSNSRILANYVQMLTTAGQVDEAARIYISQPPSFWSNDDERRLRDLLQTHLLPE